MQINYFGYLADPFGDAVFDYDETEGFSPTVIAASSTSITAVNPNNGVQVVFTGVGLPLNPNVSLTGTVTGIQFKDSSGNTSMTFSGIAWPLASMIAAIDDAFDNENSTLLLNLFNSAAPINVDASTANMGAEFFFEGMTGPANMLGSSFSDILSGTDGNDSINVGSAVAFEGDRVVGSLGSDTINIAGLTAQNYFTLSYGDYYNDTGAPTPSVTFNFDGAAGTATVTKSVGGTDTLINFADPLSFYGIDLYGSEQNDTFNVNGGAGSWMSVRGGQGNDVFNLTLSGTIRLDYRGGVSSEGYDSPWNGIVANLATGIISNDGYGGQDTLNITAGEGYLELRGSDLTDNITGSDANERFILRAGFDTLDGGGGHDVLRYDRSGVDQGINADLSTGLISGTWDGSTFSHIVSNIEEIRGTQNYADTISGSAAAERLIGNGGDDSLLGMDGSDEIIGGAGNDYLNPGDNTDYDYVDAGVGDDTIDAGQMVTGYLEIGHDDASDGSGIDVILGASGDMVNKGGNGTTTLLGMDASFGADGLGFSGTQHDDSFSAEFDGGSGGFLQFYGGAGADSYTLSGTGSGAYVRIAFHKGTPTQGVVADLSAGTISNDGLGFQDTFSNTSDARVELRLTDFNDVVTGSDAGETFIGMGGNDTIDGGGGFDILRMNRSEFSGGIELDATAGTMTGMKAGQTWTTSFSNFEGYFGTVHSDVITGSADGELFRSYGGGDTIFADGFNVVPYMDTANKVFRLYQATLDRAPDKAGHAGWTKLIESGEQTLEQAAVGFVGSQEFLQTYGGLDNAGFVGLLYQNVLERTGSQAEIDSWVDLMAGGLTQGNTILGFSESTEFRNNTTAEATFFAQATNTSFWGDDVYRLYQATLDRAPDAGGFEGWATQLSEGTTLAQVSSGFVGSIEWRNVYSSLDDTGFVNLLYNNVLGRAGDAAGIQGWLDAIAGGSTRAEVVLGFSQSQEFVTSTADDYADWVRDNSGPDGHDEIIAGSGESMLSGGLFADYFVFYSSDGSDARIIDFEAHDTVELLGFGYSSASDALSNMTQQGTDVVFSDQGTTITFDDVNLSLFDNDNIGIF